MLKVERHRLGPRVYVLGRRIHEWHLGLAVLAGDAVAACCTRWACSRSRNRAGRHLADREGLGRPHAERTRHDCLAARPPPAAVATPPVATLDDVPAIAAVAVAVVALVDLVSAVTPNVTWRGHLLVHVEPVR